MQGKGDSKHTFVFVDRSFSREVLKVRAVGDDASETSLLPSFRVAALKVQRSDLQRPHHPGAC